MGEDYTIFNEDYVDIAGVPDKWVKEGEVDKLCGQPGHQLVHEIHAPLRKVHIVTALEKWAFWGFEPWVAFITIIS